MTLYARDNGRRFGKKVAGRPFLKAKAMETKIEHSIALIRKAEKLALAMQPDEGFLVGFSDLNKMV